MAQRDGGRGPGGPAAPGRQRHCGIASLPSPAGHRDGLFPSHMSCSLTYHVLAGLLSLSSVFNLIIPTQQKIILTPHMISHGGQGLMSRWYARPRATELFLNCAVCLTGRAASKHRASDRHIDSELSLLFYSTQAGTFEPSQLGMP